MRLGDFAEGAELIEAGIHQQHVDAAGLVPDGRIDPVDVREIRGVRPDARGAANLGGGLVQLRLVAAGDEHLRPFFSEALGRAEADAGAAAGDDSDLACKFLAHDDFLSDLVRSA